jgi:class 3 adenylate cyclase/tetratricopeptide (TPR) repeat protein
MLCGQCGAENPSSHRFCDCCGAAVHAKCPACEHVNRSTARFCAECGTPLGGKPAPAAEAAPAPAAAAPVLAPLLAEGERRQVTVLFADIRGSTELIESLDPEQAADFLDPSINAMVEAVRRYGGTVSRVQGDGIMALFGAPAAQEDHAVQACFAASAMLRTIGELDGAVQIRVGLSSGEVMLRPAGSDVLDYGAVGLPAHLASRVENLCTPGRAWMTEETYRLAAGFITARSLGRFELKGVSAPVELYELVAVALKRDRWAVRAASSALTPFIGREAEMALLCDALRRARSGRGQVVTVVGEAGMGKSRFVHEFLERHGQDAFVVRVAAAAHDLTTPYLLVTDLLRGCLGVDDETDKADVERELETTLGPLAGLSALDVAALRSLLNLPVEEPGWPRLDPSQRRQQILHALRSFVLQSARARPLILVIEDAHWMDPESHAALDLLIDALVPAPLLMIVTHRPEFRHAWSRRGHHAALRAAPLDDEAAHKLARDLLGDRPGADVLARRIIERAEGMPFFVEEMARSLVQSGALDKEAGNGSGADIGDIEIPTSVRAILAARIDRLPADKRRLLQVASVIGQEVPVAILRSVADIAESELRRVLAELQEAEFLFEVELPAGIGYTFNHALTHAVAYEGLLVKQRRFLHVRVLDAVEEAYPDRLDELTERLAHHALRGEDWPRAVEYLFNAGKRANSHAAHRRAVGLFEQALEALSHLPSTPQTIDRGIEIRLGLRVALVPNVELARVRSYLDEAEVLAESIGDEARLAHITTSRCTFLGLTGSLPEAEAAGLRGLELAQRHSDPLLTLNAKFALGQAYQFMGKLEDAVAVLKPDAAQLMGEMRFKYAGTTGTTSVLYLTSLANACSFIGDFEAASTYSQEACAIADEIKRPYDLSYARLALGVLCLVRGDPEGAIERLEAALHHSRTADIQILFASIARFLGAAYTLAGRCEEAKKLLEEAGDYCRAKALTTFQVWCDASLAVVHAAMGSRDAAGRLEKTIEEARRYGVRTVEPQLLRTRGRLLSEQGQDYEATFREAIAVAQSLGMLPELAAAHEELGSALLRSDRIDEAGSELRAAQDLRRKLAAGQTSHAAFHLREIEGSSPARSVAPVAAAFHLSHKAGDAA